MSPPARLDLQGHRGARGLLPENTIPAFLKAAELGVDTIELDTVVTRDRRVIASHDPWMDPRFCTRPDGRPVRPWQRRRYAIFRMDYDDVARFDCGRRRHPDFPRQTPVAAAKPLLGDAIRAVEARIAELGREPVAYNIETKSRPAWDGRVQPPPEEFTRLLYDELRALGVLGRCTIQSFDVRTLQVLRRLDPGVATSLLVKRRWAGGRAIRADTRRPSRTADEPTAGAVREPTTGTIREPPSSASREPPASARREPPASDRRAQSSSARRLADDLERVGFTPDVYSPEHTLVDADLVREAHARGVRVIPWTVNDAADMERLIALGVDGLITDYPDVGVACRDRLRPR